uniref:Uncharacterized protein n=1 Tax=Anguilla anguilla TaxID=7936 RepID=A0A0E9PKL1_ANGAN
MYLHSEVSTTLSHCVGHSDI